MVQDFLMPSIKDVIRRLPGFTAAPSPSQYGWPSMEDIRLAVNTSSRTDPITGTTLLSKFDIGRAAQAKDQLMLASTDLKAAGFTDEVLLQFFPKEQLEGIKLALPGECREIVVTLESGSGIDAADPKSQFFFPLMVAAGIITQAEMMLLLRDDTKKPFNVTITDETIKEAMRQIPIDDQFDVFSLSLSAGQKAVAAVLDQWKADQYAAVVNNKSIGDFTKAYSVAAGV